jgi:hypothetical protein
MLLIAEMLNTLAPRIRPKYVVEAERRVYLETNPYDPERFIRPDVAIELESARRVTSREEAGAVGVAEPVTLTLPMPAEHREAYLTVRLRKPRRVVTVIEVLSPTNKKPRTLGREVYTAKRDGVLECKTHLVELDLLRGGERMPTVEPLPPADYFALVSRSSRRPKADVYPWSLRQALPSIPIPLEPEDPDVVLDLQATFTAVYDRACMDYSLDYEGEVEPPLSEADAQWAKSLLANWSGASE